MGLEKHKMRYILKFESFSFKLSKWKHENIYCKALSPSPQGIAQMHHLFGRDGEDGPPPNKMWPQDSSCLFSVLVQTFASLHEIWKMSVLSYGHPGITPSGSSPPPLKFKRFFFFLFFKIFIV